MSRYALEKGQRYLCCVWQTGPSYMVKTKGFKELEGARRWVQRILEGGTITLGKNKSAEVLEIGILAKDKRRTDWPWVEVERHMNPSIERVKEARRRAVAERGGR